MDGDDDDDAGQMDKPIQLLHYATLCSRRQQSCCVHGDHWLAHKESSCKSRRKKKEKTKHEEKGTNVSDCEFSTGLYTRYMPLFILLHLSRFATLATYNETLASVSAERQFHPRKPATNKIARRL
jgi:hypothetical protein